MAGLSKGLGWGGEPGGRARRQHTKGAPEEMRHRRAKKDTRRWCRGVEGREHQWVWREDRQAGGWQRRQNIVASILACRECQKHRGYGYRVGPYLSRGNPPEWSSAARLTFEEQTRRHLPTFYGPAF